MSRLFKRELILERTGLAASGNTGTSVLLGAKKLQLAKLKSLKQVAQHKKLLDMLYGALWGKLLYTMGLSVRRFGWPGRCPKGTCALSISLSPVSVGESPHLWLTSAGTGLDGIHPLSGKRDDLLERRSTQGAALGPVAFSFVRRALYLADGMTGKVSHPLTRSKYEMSVSIKYFILP